MDTSLETLYTSQLSAISQTYATTATQAETSTGESFADVLAALSGTGSGTNQMQQYLLDSLMDGSIEVSDGSELVSALLGTLDSENTSGSLLSYDALSGDATSGLSSDILKALLELGQNTETDWLTQILQSFSSSSTEESGDENNDALQAYYQAQAAMVQAQQNLI